MTDSDDLLAEERRLDAAERDLAERESAACRNLAGPPVLKALAVERERLAARRDVLAAQLDERAADRDRRAAERDEVAARRDREARQETGDADPGFAHRFLSARDRDDAVGDRADSLADRRRALADRQRGAESRSRAAEDRSRATAEVSAPPSGGGCPGEPAGDDVLVAQAVGVVRGRRDVPAEEALRLLRVASDTAGASVAAIAAAVVESGDLPAG